MAIFVFAPPAGAVLGWGAGNISATITTRFLWPWYENELAPTTALQFRVPRAGLLRSFRVRHNTPAGNGNVVVYTVRVNAVASLLSASLASTATDGSDLVNVVSVAAGALLDVQVTKALAIGTGVLDVAATLELLAA